MGRSGPGDHRRQDYRSSGRVRWRRIDAVAVHRSRSGAERTTRELADLSSRRRSCDRGLTGTGRERLQDRIGTKHVAPDPRGSCSHYRTQSQMIGRGVSRVDGPAKVTGSATYAYEHQEKDMLYGVILTATIARGHIESIDTADAERAPGVQAVLTYENVPAQGMRDESIMWAYWRAHPTISSAEIHHYGDAVGLVVATTLEQAQAASWLVNIRYNAAPGHFSLQEQIDQAYAPAALPAGFPPDTAVGDFQAGFDRAPVKLDQHYVLPWYFAEPMEPNACTVVPRDEDLFVYFATHTAHPPPPSTPPPLPPTPHPTPLIRPSP